MRVWVRSADERTNEGVLMITSEHAPPQRPDLRSGFDRGLSHKTDCNHSRHNRDRDGQHCPDCNEVMPDNHH